MVDICHRHGQSSLNRCITLSPSSLPLLLYGPKPLSVCHMICDDSTRAALLLIIYYLFLATSGYLLVFIIHAIDLMGREFWIFFSRIIFLQAHFLDSESLI